MKIRARTLDYSPKASHTQQATPAIAAELIECVTCLVNGKGVIGAKCSRNIIEKMNMDPSRVTCVNIASNHVRQ